MSDTVLIREVGPREGFQSFTQIVSTATKRELVEKLAATGLPEIEVCSFVRADRLPQMADAEELARQLEKVDGVKYRGLYLNPKGFERALLCPSLDVEAWLYTAASDTFLQKNANTSQERVLASIPDWLSHFQTAGKSLFGVMISTAFGCNYEGETKEDALLQVVSSVFETLTRFGSPLPRELSLADTAGWSSPKRVKRLVNAISREYGSITTSLHLHDTRGLGIASAYAGLEAGVRIFESSLGGIGGCPFAKGATGNIATEELLLLCHEQGLVTGVDLDKLFAAISYLDLETGIPLSSRLFRCQQGLNLQGAL